MICTRCHEDTGSDPDLSHLSLKYVNELCAGWLCAECMDEDPEIQAFEGRPVEIRLTPNV